MTIFGPLLTFGRRLPIADVGQLLECWQSHRLTTGTDPGCLQVVLGTNRAPDVFLPQPDECLVGGCVSHPVCHPRMKLEIAKRHEVRVRVDVQSVAADDLEIGMRLELTGNGEL